LPKTFKGLELLRRENRNPITCEGLAMNALVGNPLLFDSLQYLVDIDLITLIEGSYFKTSCILNSLTALILLNMLVVLDDFTIENRATLLYPNTHLEESKPSLDELKNNSVSAAVKAGDVIIWNSNLFHTSGVNKTGDVRRAIPITFSLPYYKQLLDYPRAIGNEKYDTFNPEMKKLLGYESRVPESISEWYSHWLNHYTKIK
jgi:hypothetical protein